MSSNQLIFDIGANIGKYAIANSANARIIAVEASPLTFPILEKNTHNIPNITQIHAAVCNSESPTVEFYHCDKADTLSTLDKEWLISPTSRFQSYGTSIQTFHVATITLDKMIDIYGIPDSIKVDVEGAEDRVLASLTKKVPVLSFEWAAEWYDVSMRTITHLTSIGFSEFHIQAEDNYVYMPPHYEYDAVQLMTELANKTPKQDWGMIWAR